MGSNIKQQTTMKRLKYSLGVLLTLAATFVSCSDKMDWEVDPTLDRCFSATSLSVSTSSTEAEVAFDASMMKTKGAEKFEIQITSENLADALAVELGKPR